MVSAWCKMSWWDWGFLLQQEEKRFTLVKCTWEASPSNAYSMCGKIFVYVFLV